MQETAKKVLERLREEAKPDDNWPEPVFVFTDLKVPEPTWTAGWCPPVIDEFARYESDRSGRAS